MTKIAIHGSAGQMGLRIAALAIESGQFDIVAALETLGHPAIGRDIGQLAGGDEFGVLITDTLPADDLPEVLIDFSLPDGTINILDICRANSIAMVTGTTGLTESQQAEIADAATVIPICQGANFSIGINVLLRVVAEMTAALGEDYDIEISEVHHRFKKDAPSGTAVALAKAACQARAAVYGETAVFGRAGQCPRKKGEIGMHALRLGDTVGEHQVHFANLGETVTITHSAHSRDIFAAGALRAAVWLASRQAGLYGMNDVLGSD